MATATATNPMTTYLRASSVDTPPDSAAGPTWVLLGPGTSNSGVVVETGSSGVSVVTVVAAAVDRVVRLDEVVLVRPDDVVLVRPDAVVLERPGDVVVGLVRGRVVVLRPEVVVVFSLCAVAGPACAREATPIRADTTSATSIEDDRRMGTIWVTTVPGEVAAGVRRALRA